MELITIQEQIEKELIVIYTKALEKIICNKIEEIQNEDTYYDLIELVENIALDKYGLMLKANKKDKNTVKAFCKNNPINISEAKKIHEILEESLYVA